MRNKLLQALPYFLLSFILFIFYKNWFLVTDIIGGDWPYYFPQTLSSFSFPPLSWVSWRGNGFGGIDVTYALHIFEHFTILGTTVFGIPWYIVTKIMWFGLFLCLLSVAAYYLYRSIFPKSGVWQRVTAVLVYSLNTYILLVASGGQMGYALGYAIAPLVVGLFINGFSVGRNVEVIKKIIVASIALGFLVMVDIRVAYMTLLIVGLYYLYVLFFIKKSILTTSIIFITPIVIAGLLNLSWILPLVLLKQDIISEVSTTYSSVESLRFFSFADFSHAFGLLHPNWPENIFGKVYFMRWEFLILPLLAFSSLLFISNNPHRRNILFFALLGLIGVFLAKGANDPLGGAYVWAFEHIPGFVMFRDPTKWYVLIVLSYSILIPFSVWNIYNWLSSKFKVQNSKLQIKGIIPMFFVLAIVCFLLILVRPAFLGQLSGTFQRQMVPQEYIDLGAYLHKQPEFYRAMWLPRQSRFTYSTSDHRVIEALPFYNATSSAQLIKRLNKADAQKQIENVGIKYIIVPYDSLGEIFQKDRRYNHKEYEYVVKELRKISWLREIPGFGNIIVFQTPSYKDHFFLVNDGKLSYVTKNTTEYNLHVESQGKNTVFFTENYNPYWIVKMNNTNVTPTKTKEGYMQFSIPQKGSYDVVVWFGQQQYYIVGFVISSVILTLLIILFIVLQYTDFFRYLKNTL